MFCPLQLRVSLISSDLISFEAQYCVIDLERVYVFVILPQKQTEQMLRLIIDRWHGSRVDLLSFLLCCVIPRWFCCV